MAPLAGADTELAEDCSTPVHQCSIQESSRPYGQHTTRHPEEPEDDQCSTSEVLYCDTFDRSQYTLLLRPERSDDGPEVCTRLARLLEAAVTRNDHGASTSEPDGCITSFHGLRPPPIPIDAYVKRIAKYAKCSPVCFAMAYTYMERLCTADASFQLTSLNVHRMLITSVLLAAKLTDDNYFNNAYYAKIGGISTAELNRLEMELFKLLDYKLWVSEEQIQRVLGLLEGPLGSRRSKKRVSEDTHLPQPPHKQEPWRHATPDSTSADTESTDALLVAAAVAECDTSDDSFDTDSGSSTVVEHSAAQGQEFGAEVGFTTKQASQQLVGCDAARGSGDDPMQQLQSGAAWQHAADVALPGSNCSEVEDAVHAEGMESLGSQLAIMASA